MQEELMDKPIPEIMRRFNYIMSIVGEIFIGVYYIEDYTRFKLFINALPGKFKDCKVTLKLLDQTKDGT